MVSANDSFCPGLLHRLTTWPWPACRRSSRFAPSRPPPVGANGVWEVIADAESVKALFKDAAGKLIGFALNGKATAERMALTQQLPPVLG